MGAVVKAEGSKPWTGVGAGEADGALAGGSELYGAGDGSTTSGPEGTGAGAEG